LTSSGLLALLLAAFMPAFPIFAQDAQRLAPKPVPVSERGNVLPSSPAERPSHGGNAVVVPALKGLVFVSSSEAIQPAGVNTSGISFTNVPMLNQAGFREQLESNLGKPLTLDRLNEITRMVVAFYREHNHPLVDVVVPEQDVQSGTIQIVVTEFRVGRIRAEGNKWFSSRLVKAPLTFNHGDTVDTRQLLGALDSANANPFRRVNLVYEPSVERGYTDLVLQTRDRFPVRVYTGYDNGGTPVTGRGRWSLGVNWGNALWHDQQLSYQFTSSTNFASSHSSGEPGGPSFVAHSVSWTMPLAWRDSITILGSYERSVPNIGQGFGLLGQSGQASLRYNKALPRTETFTQTIQAGYDFKTTNNNLDFGGTQVSANSVEIDQFPVGYSATLTDSLGLTSAGSTLVYSPGGITPNNSSAAFQPAPGQSGRMSASANYLYWRSDLNRLTKLPANATWAVRLIGQVSDRSLLDTEQLAVGGQDILRGYDPYSILGDQGIVISNELRTPTLGRRGKNDLPSTLLGQTQLLAFWDYASLHNKHAADYAPANLDASSVGLGFRYSLRTYASVRFDYGWQLQRLPGTNARGHLANIAIVLGN
jgi:hemolysin activation/secretion protein